MKNKINKIYIISFFFIGFFILSTVFIIYPLIQEIEKDSQDLTSIKEERIFNSQEIENLKNLKPILEKAEPDSEKIDTLLINSQMPIDFIKFLEDLAKNCNISMKVSSVNSGSTEQYSWKVFDFQLEVSGLYSNFSKFIEKLKNSPYLVDIIDLNISKLSGSETGLSTSSGSIIETSIHFTVFAK